MAENSLFPTAARLFYRTPNAPHVMTLPLTEWSPPSSGHIAGTCLDWTGGQVDVDSMLEGLVDLLLPFWGTGTVFSSYQIDTFADATAPARPQVSGTFPTETMTGDDGIAAAQSTFNFKTTGFGVFKFVMLDAKVSATFQPLEALVSPANDDEIALTDFLMETSNAFVGRDGFRPSSFKRVTYTLNEKLRASYRLN